MLTSPENWCLYADRAILKLLSLLSSSNLVVPIFNIIGRKGIVALLDIVWEAVDFGWEDLYDGEPEGDPLIAMLRAVEVRDQSVVQASLQPATKYAGHCLKV